MNREMIADIARNAVKDIGYDQDGFSFYGADVEVLLHGQSPERLPHLMHAFRQGLNEAGYVEGRLITPPPGDAPDFVEVGEAGIAMDDAMRRQRRVQLVG